MRTEIIVAVVIYEVVSIVLIGWYVARKARRQQMEHSFALGGRTLGAWALGTTICLICLGSGHTTGTMEGAYHIGFPQVWHTMGNGLALTLGAFTTFIWARRLRITSIGEILTKLYGAPLAIMIAAVNIAVGWAVCSCETQAMGIVINSITGWDLRTAVMIGAIIGFLYIIIGGMKQSAILNQLNIVILYVGLGLALVFIVMKLPGSNLETVENFYRQSGAHDMLSFTGGKGFLLMVAIPTLVAPFFCNICGQQTMQTAASAKNEQSIRRIAYFVGPMNCIVGGISATLALVAKSLPQYAELDGKVITMQMLVDMLPGWLIALVLAAFLAALLSSYGGFLMGPSTMIAMDFIRGLYKPEMSAKEETRWIRISLVIGAIVCAFLAQTLPPIIELFTWLFAFMIPIFFLLVYGLWWRCSNLVGLGTFLICWLCANIWTFTDVKYALGMQDVNMAYIVMGLSIVLPVIGNLVFKTRPGYFHSDDWKQSEARRIYEEEKAIGNA